MITIYPYLTSLMVFLSGSKMTKKKEPFSES